MKQIPSFSSWLNEGEAKSIKVKAETHEALTDFLADAAEKEKELPFYTQEDALNVAEFMKVDKAGEKALDELLDKHKQVKILEHENATKHYMFFQNLKSIAASVQKIMDMDEQEVDVMLADGHDWATDHIATSKDDIQEVCEFLSNSKNEKA